MPSIYFIVFIWRLPKKTGFLCHVVFPSVFLPDSSCYFGDEHVGIALGCGGDRHKSFCSLFTLLLTAGFIYSKYPALPLSFFIVPRLFPFFIKAKEKKRRAQWITLPSCPGSTRGSQLVCVALQKVIKVTRRGKAGTHRGCRGVSTLLLGCLWS